VVAGALVVVFPAALCSRSCGGRCCIGFRLGQSHTATADRAQLLVAHRSEHGDGTLDRECEDDARRVVGEQVAQVLQQNARHVAAVDDVQCRLDEVPAAQRRQRL